jgi:hypothetical protein
MLEVTELVIDSDSWLVVDTPPDEVVADIAGVVLQSVAEPLELQTGAVSQFVSMQLTVPF